MERAIGQHVAALVPDGGTVQVGIGAIPQAVLEALADHRDLAVHALAVDPIVALVERGVITGARKPFHRGRMDLAEAMGTRRLFAFLHDNRAVHMDSSAFVHDPEIVARLEGFVSINSALEIDLTGQVNAESLGPRQVAGIGGQFDFVLGASRSRGGASVIALPSTGRQGSVSRIVPRLAVGSAVTTPRFVADAVVTEHGTARLKGRGERERAAALIAVAHPGFRGSSSAALPLSGVDLREDLLVAREAVRRLVGVDALPVDEHLEDAPGAHAQCGGETVLTLDGGLQTGGLGKVVSLGAVQDLDVHDALPWNFARMLPRTLTMA